MGRNEGDPLFLRVCWQPDPPSCLCSLGGNGEITAHVQKRVAQGEAGAVAEKRCQKASLSPFLLLLPCSGRAEDGCWQVLWCRQCSTLWGLFLGSGTMGQPCQGAACPNRAVCFLHSPGVEGTIPTAGSPEQLGQAAAAGHWWPGCSWDTIPPPPPAKWQGWGLAATLGQDAGSAVAPCRKV